MENIFNNCSEKRTRFKQQYVEKFNDGTNEAAAKLVQESTCKKCSKLSIKCKLRELYGLPTENLTETMNLYQNRK